MTTSFKIHVTGIGKVCAHASNAILTFSFEHRDKDQTVAINKVAEQFEKIKALGATLAQNDAQSRSQLYTPYDEHEQPPSELFVQRCFGMLVPESLPFGFEFGVDAEYIRPKDGEPKQFDKYKAVMVVNVDVSVVKASLIVSKMMSAGMTSWLKTYFYVAPQFSKQIAEKALAQAVDSATNKANVIARASRSSITNYVCFNERSSSSELYFENKRNRSYSSHSMNECAIVSTRDDDDAVKFPLIEPPVMEFTAGVDAEFVATPQTN